MDLSADTRLGSRVTPVRRAVILSAGKASRLAGKNKLLVDAGDRRVSDWHRALLDGYRTAVVTRPVDAAEIAIALPWVDRVVGHPEADGPVGALSAYLSAYPEDEEIVVLFADTLLVPQPLPAGDWVGVAAAPARRWDFPAENGHWARGVVDLPVCVGIYAFAYPAELRRAIVGAREDAETIGVSDIPMTLLLNRYAREATLPWKRIRGWHDAGDPEAIALVPRWEEAIRDDPTPREVDGTLTVRWRR
jgi:CTP:molybdopterin cytidylyltransferase MocA